MIAILKSNNVQSLIAAIGYALYTVLTGSDLVTVKTIVAALLIAGYNWFTTYTKGNTSVTSTVSKVETTTSSSTVPEESTKPNE